MRLVPQVRSLLASGFGQVRYEPTAKRIRAVLGGATVVDSTRAVLVWEPRRIVPSYGSRRTTSAASWSRRAR